MIRTTNVRDGRIDLGECRCVEEATFERWTRRAKVLDGDVILTREAPIGEVGFANGLGSVFLGQRIMQFRPDPSKIEPRYLYYAFRSPDLQHQFGMHDGSGSVVSHIRVADCHEFKVSAPPLDQQGRVVELLGSIDDKIELNRRMNETLEAMAQAIFRDWFVDFGPVRRKLEGTTDPVAILGGLMPDPARAAELASLFPDGVSEDELPVGWSEPPLSEHLEIIGGGTPKTSNPAYWGGDIPWFSVVDTPSGSDVFVFDTEKSITPAGLAGSSARLIPAGTTIISARGTVGNLAIAAQDMTFNQSCYALQSARGDHPYFVYLLAAHAVDQLRSMAHGSVFSTITRQTFDAMSFASPHVAVLDAIEGLLSPLFQRIKAAVAENRTLAETRDYLLPRLMSGEIRVGEAAELVEGAA
jgi:type I restriction enzyme S subunit